MIDKLPKPLTRNPHDAHSLPVEVYRQGLLMLASSYDALSDQAGRALAACEWRAKQSRLEANLEAEHLAMRLAQNQVGQWGTPPRLIAASVHLPIIMKHTKCNTACPRICNGILSRRQWWAGLSRNWPCGRQQRGAVST